GIWHIRGRARQVIEAVGRRLVGSRSNVRIADLDDARNPGSGDSEAPDIGRQEKSPAIIWVWIDRHLVFAYRPALAWIASGSIHADVDGHASVIATSTGGQQQYRQADRGATGVSCRRHRGGRYQAAPRPTPHGFEQITSSFVHRPAVRSTAHVLAELPG